MRQRLHAAQKAAAEKAARAPADRAAADKAAAEKAAAERLARARRAGQVAAHAWTSLEELLECVDVVREGRGHGKNSVVIVLAEVIEFAALRKELEAVPVKKKKQKKKGAAVHAGGTATVEEACRSAEEQVRESRSAAEASQREVSQNLLFLLLSPPATAPRPHYCRKGLLIASL